MKVLEIREIEIDKIAVPDWARRTVMSEAELDDLANSIRERGQIGPIVVRPRSDGRYELVSGSRRLEVLKRLGRTEVEAKVIECTDEEAIVLSIEENLKRAEEHVFDTARKVSMLYEMMGNSGRKVARLLDRDETWVSMMKKINAIDEAAKKVLAPHVRDYHKLYLVATVEDPEKQRIMAKVLERLNLSREKVEELVRVANATTVEGFRDYCERLLGEEGEARREGSPEPGGFTMVKPLQVQVQGQTSSSKPGEFTMVKPPQVQEQGVYQLQASTEAQVQKPETRECWLCGRVKPREKTRAPVLCSDEHQEVWELLREIKRRGIVNVDDILGALVEIFRRLADLPKDMRHEVARSVLRHLEEPRPLDVDLHEKPLDEVKGRDDQDQD